MGGAPSSKKADFLDREMTLYDMRVASRLHDNWRAPRRLPDGTFEPRIKVVNGRKFDIANMSFRELPAKLQYENLVSTKIVCSAVVEQMENNTRCSKEFVEETAETLHVQYQSRHVDDANTDWKDLSAEEQDKARQFVFLAIDVYHDMHHRTPARGRTVSEEIAEHSKKSVEHAASKRRVTTAW
mmetsp:Transcript_46716/g.69081  ORF Transcript_46716/g.69081 Transcript_46716/m.69081 type:complete len:184 (-) Transcript_46716:38-589(-)|eukprot:CAMPEP_0195528688 /NCGR_PEP_ID=MMETSP0794_2-20130614/30952_1 /TAXON_ID=515487 /ORGANISM="Stephanopyxis turris, Strain CCMP 815" /LENGTH=183 /DNA_ID=CAMNT_0040659865 /DNA_START=267 /DNA_END=818 /DNA_ORIENTATION=+